jgi:sensor domain CHASE-containing protein
MSRAKLSRLKESRISTLKTSLNTEIEMLDEIISPITIKQKINIVTLADISKKKIDQKSKYRLTKYVAAHEINLSNGQFISLFKNCS